MRVDELQSLHTAFDGYEPPVQLAAAVGAASHVQKQKRTARQANIDPCRSDQDTSGERRARRDFLVQRESQSWTLVVEPERCWKKSLLSKNMIS